METKVNLAIVGVFVLLLGAALVGGVLWLSSEKSYRKAYDTYLILMEESVSGLSVDAPVRYRGVQVGRVRQIALALGNVERVQLTLDIERGTPIKQSTVAVLRTQGLTGIGHIELAGGNRDSPALTAQPGADYPVILSGPSMMVRMDAAVTTLLGNLARSSENLNAVLDESNRAALAKALASLEIIVGTLATRSREIDAGVVGAARTMENAARLSGELSSLIERIQRSAAAFDRMSAEGARVAAVAAKAVEGASDDWRQMTREAAPEARLLIAELRELTASLRRSSEQLERNPAMLVHGRHAGKPGPGE